MAGVCKKCRRALDDEAAGTGRRPSYCSPGCRRAAEFEIRRVDHRLGTLEQLRARFSRYIRTGDDTFVQGWGRPKAALESVEFEIREAEERLLELLEE